ncbi:MAG: phage baseplate assembly protein V [Oscillospiraceae bacterium]|jgi:uncharacterized protein involved in type VI secretion and phage assembly
MALYDIIEEISDEQVLKTETGDSRMYGVTLGTVTKDFDEKAGGRVCVTVPTRAQKAEKLMWARVAMPSGGAGWGHYFLPEPGDQVLLAFENGNIERPYVIGCINKDNDKFFTGSIDKDNRIKRIVTRNGSTLTYEDVPIPEGDKKNKPGDLDKITLQTAGKQLTLLLDNENHKIRLGDKEKEDFIEMDTTQGSGTLLLQAKSKITIKVGDNITFTLNGESGAVKIEAKQLAIEAPNQISLKSDGMVKLEGGTISQKASSAFKADSSGAVTISGTPITIG